MSEECKYRIESWWQAIWGALEEAHLEGRRVKPPTSRVILRSCVISREWADTRKVHVKDNGNRKPRIEADLENGEGQKGGPSHSDKKGSF